MKTVEIAAVQFATKADRNTPGAGSIVLAELNQVFERLQGYGLDLVVFCEGVGSIGQSLETAERVADPGPFLQSYITFARNENCLVAASIKTLRDNKVYNSLVFIDATGEVLGCYDKANLTQGELARGLMPGHGPVVVDTAIGRIGGIICFDLNFEWLRFEYRKLRPDILCFASMYHGGLMRQLWAYECQSFFVSALPFSDSGILDPVGRTLSATNCYTSIARCRVNLDRALVHLDHNREKFPDIERKYGPEVSIEIPPNLGPALIYSHTQNRTAKDVIREFCLEPLDDYLESSLAENIKRRRH